MYKYFSLSLSLLVFNLLITPQAPEIRIDDILNYQTNYIFSCPKKLNNYQLFLQKQGWQTTLHPERVECQKPTSSSFMNPEAIEDLGLKNLVQQISTFTDLGPWGLMHLLLNPLTDSSSLHNRSTALRFLVDNNDVFVALTNHIKTINYKSITNYWKLYDAHTKAESLYFSHFFNTTLLKNLHLRNKSLNKNYLALDISNNLIVLYALKRLVMNFALSGVTSEIASAGLHTRRPQINLNTITQGFTYPFRIHSLKPDIFKDSMDVDVYPLIEQSKLSGGDWFLYFNHKLKESVSPAVATTLAVCATGATIASYDFSQIIELYRAVQDIKLTYATAYQLHKNLIEIAHSLRALRLLVSYIQEYPELAHLPGYDDLHQILSTRNQNSDKLNQLIDLLATDTFRQEANFYSKGKVLIAHKLLKSISYEIVPLLQAMAKIDAFLSIVQLLETAQNWSLAQVSEHPTAYIDLKGFWNPHLPHLKITNDINLGQKTPHHAIFSGPNGGGKSTTMQSIALSILLAQSWCIVPAEQASLSLFTHMLTYLAPQANIKTGTSTFMAEKARLDQMMQKLRTSAHKNIFIMLDEPLRGTIEREAAQRICATGLELANYPYCCSVIATHIEKPTQLAQTNPEFANYQMELFINDRGGFERTFKLLPGAASWWFNDDIKRSKFIDDLNL